MTVPLKILIPMHGFVGWNGGVDLLGVIVKSLRAVAANEQLELIYAVPYDFEGIDPAIAAARARVRAFMLEGRIVECFEDAKGLNLAAIESGADLIFPTMLPIRTNHVRKIGYIYDFQHKDLPHWFSPAERARRDEEFAEIARRCDAMYCTSQVVAKGLNQHLGVDPSRILVMPYTAYVEPHWFEGDPDAVRAKYQIGPRYLMVSNHFWIHKDHRVVIDAFARLIQAPDFADLELVMTGDTSDFRDPSHYPNLLAHMAELGIANRSHSLGFIAKSEQLALLRGSLMLVQPTLYEGAPGGGASYEGIGLGVPTLLSDIPVNLEVRGESAAWFRAGDADDLLRQMLHVLRAPPARPGRDALNARSQQALSTTGKALASFLRRLHAG